MNITEYNVQTPARLSSSDKRAGTFFVRADNYKADKYLYNIDIGFVQNILKRLHKEELSGFNFVFQEVYHEKALQTGHC